MEIILFGIGALILIAGIVIGFMSETLIATIISSSVVACIFFALAKIIGNQEIIINHQQELLNNAILSRRDEGKKPCHECGKSYPVSMKSCPYCGIRRED